MSKADYFRRFAIWNRQLPETAQTAPKANQVIDAATAPIEAVAVATVVARPLPTAFKVEDRTVTFTARGIAAPLRPPLSPTINYLTTAEAADLCRLSARTLERYRVSGGGPLFSKCGPGKRARVVYRRGDLEAWLASNAVSSTADWSVRSRKPK